MSQKIINIGTTPNDGTGDPLRTSFDKSNDNFTELYNIVNGNTYRTTVSPENISIPTDYDGSNPDLTNAISTIYVNTATEDQTASWVWVIDTETDCTATVSNNNIVTVDTITEDSGIITLTASNIAFPTITLTATITVTRAKQGDPGTTLVDDDTIRLNGSSQVECLILGRSTNSALSGRFWYGTYEATRALIAAEITTGSDEPMVQGDYSIGLGRYSLNTGEGTIGVNAGSMNNIPTPGNVSTKAYEGNYSLIIGGDFFNTGKVDGILGTGDYSIIIGRGIENEGDRNLILSDNTADTTTVNGDGNLLTGVFAGTEVFNINSSLILSDKSNAILPSGTVKNALIRGQHNIPEYIGEDSNSIGYINTDSTHKIYDLILGKTSVNAATAELSLTGDLSDEFTSINTSGSRQAAMMYKISLMSVNNDSGNFEYYHEDSVGVITSVLGVLSTTGYTKVSDTGVVGGFEVTVTPIIIGTTFRIQVQVIGGSNTYAHTAKLELIYTGRRYT